MPGAIRATVSGAVPGPPTVLFTSSTTTQITMWLDPTPGTTDPANATALSLGGQQLVNVTGLHFNTI